MGQVKPVCVQLLLNMKLCSLSIRRIPSPSVESDQLLCWRRFSVSMFARHHSRLSVRHQHRTQCSDGGGTSDGEIKLLSQFVFIYFHLIRKSVVLGKIHVTQPTLQISKMLLEMWRPPPPLPFISYTGNKLWIFSYCIIFCSCRLLQ